MNLDEGNLKLSRERESDHDLGEESIFISGTTSDTEFLKSVGINPKTELSFLDRIRWTMKKIHARIMSDSTGRMLAKEVVMDFLVLSALLFFVIAGSLYLAITTGWQPRETSLVPSIIAIVVAYIYPCMMAWLKFLDLQLSYHSLKSFYNFAPKEGPNKRL